MAFPRRGTTSIQDYLWRGYSEAARDGVRYPPLNITWNAPNHTWLGDSLRRRNLDALADYLKQCEALGSACILSDENVYVEFSGMSSDFKDSVRALFAQHDVTVVSVSRDMAPWQKSFYAQSVQMRRNNLGLGYVTANHMWQTPDTFADFWAAPYAAQLLDVADMTTNIAEMFGADRQVHITYQEGQDILDQFCAELGLTWVPEKHLHKRNPSLSDTQVEVLRQANGMRRQDGRMIRLLIGCENGGGVRHKQRQEMMGWAQEVDWSLFGYHDNPPLHYDKDTFDFLLERLQYWANKLCDTNE